jgi:hypothetical protein
MKSRRPRGIAMVIGLLSLVVVVMIVAAAVTLMPTQIFASTHSGDNQEALLAANSGLDYAQARLQEQPWWSGDDPAGTIVNTPQLRIVEDTGNVIGVMTRPDGSKSAFRIKFNHQNVGASPDEGFATNPLSNRLISSPHVSVNNIQGLSDAPIYTANSAGVVPTTAVAIDNVPKFNARVVVEGLAGPGLASATVDNLDTLATRPGVYTQAVECRFSVLNLASVDSAVYAAGVFEASATAAGGKVKVTEAEGATAAQVRSLTSANIHGSGGYETSTQGTVVVDTAGSFNVDAGTTLTPSKQGRAQQQSHWMKVRWNDLDHATNANTQVMAGTYVWRNDSGTPRLYHYPSDYVAGDPVPTTGGTLINSPGDMVVSGDASHLQLDNANATTIIRDKVVVAPSGGATDFTILMTPDLQTAMLANPATNRARPYITFQPAPGGQAVFTSPGDMQIAGGIEGLGTVTAGGNITIQGTSIFEADPNSTVGIYTRENLKVEAIPDPVAIKLADTLGGAVSGMGGMGMLPPGLVMNGMIAPIPGMGMTPTSPTIVTNTPGDLSLAGVFFASKNFSAHVPNGDFYLRGILTAYGGNADTQNPGDETTAGLVEMQAYNIDVTYDPSYLQSAVMNNSPIRLTRVAWNLR